MGILDSTTSAVGVGMLASPTISTTTNCIHFNKDDDAAIEGLSIKPKGSIIPTSVATGTTATGLYQEYSYSQVLEAARNTQAYVESLDDQKLAELSEMLEEKALDFELSDENSLGEYPEGQKPYTKF